MKKQLVQERENMVCKERLKRVGKHFQLPRQRNWANTSKMIEKNKAMLYRMRALFWGWGAGVWKYDLVESFGRHLFN